VGFLTTSGISHLDWALHVAGLRHQAVAHNLSNLSTPGYKRLAVTFDGALSSAARNLLPVATTHPGHVRPGSGSAPSLPQTWLQPVTSTSARPDGNNVDLEHELATLSENTLHHQALLRQLNQRLAALRLAVTEGRK